MSDFTVLVVEDELSARTIITEALKFAGIAYIAVDNCAEALQLAILHQPEIAILDMNLPDADGKQLCQALQTHPDTGHIKILFLTASRSFNDVLFGVRAHIAGFYNKGVPIGEIIQYVIALNSDAHMREEVNSYKEHHRAMAEKYSEPSDDFNIRT